MKPTYLRLMVAPVFAAGVVVAPLPIHAVKVNEQLEIGGILAATGQCQNVSARLPAEDDGEPLDRFGNECRGGMPIQFEISYQPNDAHEFSAKLGFAASNGLNQVSPWKLTPWAADLEDDLKDINGRSRDHLLTAWYKYTHTFRNQGSLGASVGIIDATDYIDGNQCANDEFIQFMNEVFVNSGSYNLGSYDTGAALEWKQGEWTLTGLGINIGENDAGNNYNFWGVEVGYHPETAMGKGNYHLTLTGTSSARTIRGVGSSVCD